MDAINDVIVSTLEAFVFIVFGFALLWVMGEIQKYIKTRRRKRRERKKINIKKNP